VKNSPTNSIFGFDEVECPIRTVPIRRMTKDDLIRAKSLWNDNILTATAVHHVCFLLNDLILNVIGLFFFFERIRSILYILEIFKFLRHNKEKLLDS
jgi:hypothetical protein